MEKEWGLARQQGHDPLTPHTSLEWMKLFLEVWEQPQASLT